MNNQESEETLIIADYNAKRDEIINNMKRKTHGYFEF